jgi:[acyl-carrier-protein] S-malonyltransferase
MAKDFGGKKAVLLEVSGAFHSPLMEMAYEKLKELLRELEFHKFKVPVISNVNAEPYWDPLRAKELLALQVKSPVLWEDSVRRLVALGVDAFVELGPGKVLTGLIKRTLPTVKTLNLETSQDLEGLREGLKIIKN